MITYDDTATRRAARELAALLAEARAHWGIPDPPARGTPIAPEGLTAAARLPIIIERYRAGVELDVIADDLGVPLNTIRTQIYRARQSGAWPDDLRRGRT